MSDETRYTLHINITRACKSKLKKLAGADRSITQVVLELVERAKLPNPSRGETAGTSNKTRRE